MKFIIFLIYMPLVHSELHRFMTTYTGISGQTAAGIPEFFAVTTLDDQQIDYYDSIIMELIPKQDWMKEFVSKDTWREETMIRQSVQMTYKNNILVLMHRLNQTQGLHTFQRMYGCEWDDETEVSQGFDQYGYDGEDFISLDLKQRRYISPVQQGILTVQKWNNDRAQLEYLIQYYSYECAYWLKYFLKFRKEHLERRAPEVSLLQKDPYSPLVCHATGFYPSGVTITWLRNGLEHHEDVDLGELLPNEDETFQKTSSIRVTPDEWNNDQYACVVEHMGETIQRTEIKRPKKVILEILVYWCVIGVSVLVIGAVVCSVIKKRKSGHKPVSSKDESYSDKSL